MDQCEDPRALDDEQRAEYLFLRTITPLARPATGGRPVAGARSKEVRA